MQCYEFHPIGGGGAKVAYGLARQLVRMGHKVDLVTMGFRGLPRQEVVDGICVHRVPCIRLKESICFVPEMITYIIPAVLTVLKLLRKKNYQILHTHFIFPDGLVSLIIKLITGRPFIITAHGSDVPGYNPNRFKLLHVFLKPLWKLIASQSSEIVFPSNALKLLFNSQINHIKTSVIPNGIDLEGFSPNYQRRKDGQILLVSRLFERKGLQYFLQAIKGINLKHEIYIVGDGPYRKALEETASTIKTKIKFLGWMDNQSKEFTEIFKRSQIFVFVSEVENCPIVLLEAMRAGLAIITTKSTGCAEVVGDAALLVEPKNVPEIRTKLEKLIQNHELCKDLGQSARKRVEELFSWQSIAQRYNYLYTTLLSKNESQKENLALDMARNSVIKYPPVRSELLWDNPVKDKIFTFQKKG